MQLAMKPWEQDTADFRKALYVKDYGVTSDGENWKTFQIGGKPQETFGTGSGYDCSGQTFCMSVDSYLWGFITIGRYGVDV
jgi:hypothetical protein